MEQQVGRGLQGRLGMAAGAALVATAVLWPAPGGAMWLNGNSEADAAAETTQPTSDRLSAQWGIDRFASIDAGCSDNPEVT